MKAFAYDQFGPLDVMHLAEIAEPKLAKGQLLVKVRAASLNVIDLRVRNGLMGPLVSKKFPKVPGSDLSGVVEEVGPGVIGFSPGDAVYGAADPLKGGVLTEYVVLPATQLAPKPEELSFEEAAAVPVTGLAALYTLRDLGKVKTGSEVLIHGASGPVGLFAIQIAKAMGAKVTAVAGTSGVAAVRSFGADTIIDYRTQGGTAFGKNFDVIINASGKMPFALGKRFLKSNGRLIEPSPTIPVFIGSMLANVFRSKKHLVLTTVPKRADLDFLSSLIAQGKLKPSVAEVFPLSEAKQAFAAMEKGGANGKIIVTI